MRQLKRRIRQIRSWNSIESEWQVCREEEKSGAFVRIQILKFPLNRNPRSKSRMKLDTLKSITCTQSIVVHVVCMQQTAAMMNKKCHHQLHGREGTTPTPTHNDWVGRGAQKWEWQQNSWDTQWLAGLAGHGMLKRRRSTRPREFAIKHQLLK